MAGAGARSPSSNSGCGALIGRGLTREVPFPSRGAGDGGAANIGNARRPASRTIISAQLRCRCVNTDPPSGGSSGWRLHDPDAVARAPADTPVRFPPRSDTEMIRLLVPAGSGFRSLLKKRRPTGLICHPSPFPFSQPDPELNDSRIAFPAGPERGALPVGRMCCSNSPAGDGRGRPLSLIGVSARNGTKMRRATILQHRMSACRPPAR